MRLHKWTLEGRTAFPIDGLRRDRCWPAESKDVATIVLSFDPHRSVMLSRPTLKVDVVGLDPLTLGLWESHGWLPISHEVL